MAKRSMWWRRAMVVAGSFAMLAAGASALAEPTVDQLMEQGDWAAVLGVHLTALERNPADGAARKGAWMAAMRLGLFEQAATLEAPLTAAERRALEGDRIALAIRYGRIDARSLVGPARYQQLDAAIAHTDALATSLASKPAAPLDAEDQRRLTDRLSALAARGRSAEAVALYEALQSRQVAVPAWALGDVAGAYLSQRRPEQAASLYRQVLAASPDDFDANLGLFYARVESEQMDAATAHIDTFAVRLPTRRHRDGEPNGEQWSALIASDQARLYADRLDEAQQRIEQRLDVAPFNAEARQAEASLHLARGWPSLGEADLRRNLGQDPNNANLHADRAEVLLALQRWADARQQLEQAQQLAPDAPRVRQAAETFALHDRMELSVEAGYGHGQAAGPYGSSDWNIDTRLYSNPLHEAWRVFAHNFAASGDFDGSDARWVRTGAGLEWRSGDWQLSGEVNGGEGEQAGLLTTARWMPDDHWRIDAAADTLTNDVPLQAVRAGVTARRGELGATWLQHESRSLGLSVNVSDFSDGNVRRVVSGSWFERWVSGPRWMVETRLGADASRNSLGTSAAYFNPPQDTTAWLAGTLDNLTWRNYDYSLRQRLTITVGNYWQSGYGAGRIQAIEYRHHWELGRAVALQYGIGRSLRPYDGEREARNFGMLNLLWRF